MLRNGTTGDWMGSLVGHKGAVWCCRMDVATQTMIATASGDFSCRVYDAITGTCIYTLTDAKHILKTCDFNPISTTLLATAGHEGIVRIYNLVEQERRYFGTASTKQGDAQQNVVPMEIRVPPLSVEEADGTGTTGTTSTTTHCKTITIGKLNWYNDHIFLIGCSDGTIRFYNVESILPSTSNRVTTTTTDNNTTNSKSNEDYPPLHIISTNMNTPLTPSSSSTNCEIRDMEIKPINTPVDHETPPAYTALTIATGKTIYIYDVTDLHNIQLRVKYTLNTINFYNEGGISLHPTGTKFIVGGSDLYVYLYSIAYNKNNDTVAAEVTQIECYKGHHGPIRCLRYSPDGTTFASGSEDGTIRLWQQP